METLGMLVKVPTKPLLDYLNALDLPNNAMKAKAISISLRHYSRLLKKQEIYWATADRYAIRLGLHPAIIWRDWYLLTNGVAA